MRVNNLRHGRVLVEDVLSIGDACEFAYGKALQEDIRRPGRVPVYGSNGQVGYHDEALVQGPGIVVGRKGNPGTVTWVHMDFSPIDTTFYVVQRGPVESMPYLFHALGNTDLPALSADSAVPGLNRTMAYMSKILGPTKTLLSAFDDFVMPLFTKAFLNGEESRILADLRDALLPRLLSGDIRIGDAEALVEAAV